MTWFRDQIPRQGDYGAALDRLDAAEIEWSLFIVDISTEHTVTVYIDDPDLLDDWLSDDGFVATFDLTTGALLPTRRTA